MNPLTNNTLYISAHNFIYGVFSPPKRIYTRSATWTPANGTTAGLPSASPPTPYTTGHPLEKSILLMPNFFCPSAYPMRVST